MTCDNNNGNNQQQLSRTCKDGHRDGWRIGGRKNGRVQLLARIKLLGIAAERTKAQTAALAEHGSARRPPCLQRSGERGNMAQRSAVGQCTIQCVAEGRPRILHCARQAAPWARHPRPAVASHSGRSDAPHAWGLGDTFDTNSGALRMGAVSATGARRNDTRE